MIRVAILDDYQRAALDAADWSSLGDDMAIEVFDRHLGFDDDAVATALAPFEVVIAMRERTPFPASLIAKLPALRLLVTTGMRNLAIDMDAARERGIVVSGTSMLPYPAFELTWALILAVTKNIPREDRSIRDGGWQCAVATGLNAKVLGVIGLGKLGAQVAKVGKAFGMDVIAWSENLTEARAAECGVRLVGKNELFSIADVVTIHLVLGDRSLGLVGEPELALMKPSAFLINTSRGPIVDEAALVGALRASQIAGAGLDVYDVEPLPRDHPLRSLDNTVLTGHTGYVVGELFTRVYAEAVENIAAWRSGASIRVLNES